MRRRLTDLGPDDHGLFHEMAEIGGTDFFAMPLEFGDGSVQGMSLVADGESGLSDEHVDLFERLRHPLAAAMEPVAMRRSTRSLLKTYLGSGPAESVNAGSISRGDLSTLNAVVMFSDLRGFTDKSSRWSDRDLLEALDGYFEVVVDAVRRLQGDVLKFLGDGVLAVFPIAEDAAKSACCADALNATADAREGLIKLNEVRREAGREPLDFGTALYLGNVTYGNIGSPDRLDFTVIGETVNMASRIGGLCKMLGEPALCSESMRQSLASELRHPRDPGRARPGPTLCSVRLELRIATGSSHLETKTPPFFGSFPVISWRCPSANATADAPRWGTLQAARDDA